MNECELTALTWRGSYTWPFQDVSFVLFCLFRFFLCHFCLSSIPYFFWPVRLLCRCRFLASFTSCYVLYIVFNPFTSLPVCFFLHFKLFPSWRPFSTHKDPNPPTHATDWSPLSHYSHQYMQIIGVKYNLSSFHGQIWPLVTVETPSPSITPCEFTHEHLHNTIKYMLLE